MNPSVSGDGSRSCSTCHPGQGTNGLSYRGAEEVPSRSPGALDVPALWGLRDTGPYLLDGSARTVGDALDRMLELEMRGAILSPEDRGALESYLWSINRFDRGRVDEEGRPIEPVTRSARDGFEVFGNAGCTVCHPPSVYARSGRFDVGTGGRLSVPTLRGVGQTPPYGHDGRWSTLEEAVRAILEARKTRLEPADLRRLLAYLELL